MVFSIATGALESFLSSSAGQKVTKIYIKGQDVTFQQNCITRGGTAAGLSFFVTSIENKNNLKEALNLADTDIQSIEELQQRIEAIENGSLFKGILNIQKNSNGEVGLMIEDTMKINNQPLTTTNGTNYNLCLENSTADINRKNA